ncbi:hypothetical protein SAMN05421856_104361 [Chryseobacterium taichungense]|uniref:Cupin domain-containing protein n=1 Tax=Chryseobacterium taichungense TaxID=295069 RepID=A0A1H7ZLB8_9FLAO|nr:hypothetical protein [Chryseobacterium taichungense]SEM59190.1 hypothetical protein SAMN05421856_104361 [Chryseobacterium taichungense]
MNETSEFIAAIRLINNPDGNSAFEMGRIPVLKPIKTTSFWISNKTEEWEKAEHPAPRKQFVVTLKGKIRFKVSDGSTFIIEPGIILLAEDVEGKGHSWELEEGEKWERLYIPVDDNDESGFIPD